MDEDSLSSEERAVIEFFLSSFKKNHLNLKNITSINAEVARRHLIFPFYLSYISFCLAFLFTLYFWLPFTFANEMATKSAMAKFHCYILKRLHEEGGNNSQGPWVPRI